MKLKNKTRACLSGSSQLKAPARQLKLLNKAVLLGMLTMGSHSAISFAAVSNNITGEVERIIVNDPLDTWSSGIMVVGGVNVIIPRNMVFELPANRLTLQQMFVNAPSSCVDSNADGVPDETGLGKADSCNTSFTGATASILANKTNAGNIIAGDVFLEKATETVAGTISYINYDEGYFRVDGNLNDPATGVMIRVNDPEGRHTRQTGAGCAGSGPNCSADVRYGVDPDNYTFKDITGYPTCIPSTFSRTYSFDADRSGVIDPAETNLSSFAAPDGTGDALCPQTNRPGVGVVAADSRLFAPINLGDSITADGNFETIGGVTFLSAYDVGVLVGMTTANDPFQPDYIIFDEVGWDVPGYQNQRVRDLLIGFATLSPPQVDIFGLYSDPDSNSYQELVFATTVGCDIAAGVGACTTQGIVGNTAIFKIVHDVDYLVNLTAPIKPIRSPCQQLNAAYANGGIPDKNGNLLINPVTGVSGDPKGRCTGNITLAKEFEVLAPATRDIMGRSRHQHALDPSVVTLDFKGRPTQNGQYLNPTGIGHPEFVEINLAAIQTPLIFTGEQWNMDRRLGPGGCDGVCETTAMVPIGDPSMRLDPFPFSDLDPGTQNGVSSVPGSTPVAPGYLDQKGRPLSYWPLTPAEVLPWPPVDPAALPITPTLHAGLMCTILSGVDTDLDGVDDALDNCTLVSNGPLTPSILPQNIQRDSNGDGFGNICDADVDNDGFVGFGDFILIRSLFGTADPDADLDGDGLVGFGDFSILNTSFGSAPGPSALAP